MLGAVKPWKTILEESCRSVLDTKTPCSPLFWPQPSRKHTRSLTCHPRAAVSTGLLIETLWGASIKIKRVTFSTITVLLRGRGGGRAFLEKRTGSEMLNYKKLVFGPLYYMLCKPVVTEVFSSKRPRAPQQTEASRLSICNDADHFDSWADTCAVSILALSFCVKAISVWR